MCTFPSEKHADNKKSIPQKNIYFDYNFFIIETLIECQQNIFASFEYEWILFHAFTYKTQHKKTVLTCDELMIFILQKIFSLGKYAAKTERNDPPLLTFGDWMHVTCCVKILTGNSVFPSMCIPTFRILYNVHTHTLSLYLSLILTLWHALL